jgi:hypothetical protein
MSFRRSHERLFDSETTMNKIRFGIPFLFVLFMASLGAKPARLLAYPPERDDLLGDYSGTVEVQEIVSDAAADKDDSLTALYRILKGRKFQLGVKLTKQDDGSLALKTGEKGQPLNFVIPVRYADSGTLTGKRRERRPEEELVADYELIDVSATFEPDPSDTTPPLDRLVRLKGTIQLTVFEAKVEKSRKIRFDLSALSTSNRGPDPDDPTDDPRFGEDTGASFSSLSREVEIHRWKDGAWDFAEFVHPNTRLRSGDKVVVGENSHALISFADGSTLMVRPRPNDDQAVVIIAMPPKSGTQVDLLLGRLKVNFKKIIAGEAIEVKSQQAVIGTKGTVFEVEATSDETSCKVSEGAVTVRHRKTGKTMTVSTGQKVTVSGIGLGAIESYDPAKETFPEPDSTPSASRYAHPGGVYMLPLPTGWHVLPGMRNKVADRGSDTLKDASGKFVVIVRRQVDKVDKPEVVLHRWLSATMSVDKSLLDPQFNNLRVSRVAFGALKGLRLTYAVSGEQVISRMALANEGRWCVINTVSPAEYGTADFPAPIRELLNGLEALPIRRSESSGDSTKLLGKLLAQRDTLEGLTRDLGLTVYERGVVVHDHRRGIDQVVRVGGGEFPLLAGAEGFLRRDPALLPKLGEALTPEVAVFDCRVGVQIFRGGVVVHDPQESLIWQMDHPQRAAE